ncbi:MAG: diguanylate cyclase [Nitrospina sp.]|nr:diguanylate cyclase [Nitrospina sp.]
MPQNSQILIVDDNHSNVDVLKRSLETKGYGISIAPSGEVALKIAPKLKPDLILMDLMMPGMDGFETCKKIKELPEIQDVPIIFVTGKTETEDIVKAFRVGGVDYISKPFREEEIQARVAAQIRIRKLIGEKEKLIQELDLISRIDPLTRLSNRRDIQEVLGRELSRCQRYENEFSIIMGDIDFFKKVNDQYGHDMGDNVLKEVAGMLQNEVRKIDKVARWGGEEFLIVLPDTDLPGAYRVAEKIRAAVELRESRFDEAIVKLTMSFGVAGISEVGGKIEEMIKLADLRLYKAKDQGRNKVVSD